MTDFHAPAATAAKAIAGTLLRHAITAAGALLVAQGIVDQSTASSATAPIADYVLGAGLALGAAGWGAIRAKLTHTRWAAAWEALTGEAEPPA